MRTTAVLSLLCVLLLVGHTAGQTICAKYAEALFPGYPEPEATLMQHVINAAITGLVSDPITMNWFNGINNDAGKNFSSPAHAADLTTLTNHLIGFFGYALGCNSTSFQAGGNYSIDFVDTNMYEVHTVVNNSNPSAGGFQKGITAAAFNRFNELVMGILLGAGMSSDDAYTVSTVLDSFRGPYTGGLQTNQVCQDPSCASVFEVDLRPEGFAPSYIKITHGNSLSIYSYGTAGHVVKQASGFGACTAIGSFSLTIGANNTDFTVYTANSVNATSAYFFDSSNCPAGSIQVDSTGGSASSLVSPLSFLLGLVF